MGGCCLILFTTGDYGLILGGKFYIYQHDVARRSCDLTVILYLIHSRMCNAQYWSYAQDTVSILRTWIPNTRVTKYSLSPPKTGKSKNILILNLTTLSSTMNNTFLRTRQLRDFVYGMEFGTSHRQIR